MAQSSQLVAQKGQNKKNYCGFSDCGMRNENTGTRKGHQDSGKIMTLDVDIAIRKEPVKRRAEEIGIVNPFNGRQHRLYFINVLIFFHPGKPISGIGNQLNDSIRLPPPGADQFDDFFPVQVQIDARHIQGRSGALLRPQDKDLSVTPADTHCSFFFGPIQQRRKLLASL